MTETLSEILNRLIAERDEALRNCETATVAHADMDAENERLREAAIEGLRLAHRVSRDEFDDDNHRRGHAAAIEGLLSDALTDDEAGSS